MQKSKKWAITGLIAGILFVALATSVAINPQWLVAFESSVQGFMQTIQNQQLTQAGTTISFFGSPAVDLCWTAILAILIWFGSRNLLLSLWIVMVQVGGDAIALVFKELIKRPRPVLQLVKDTGYSFPSGHMFGTTIVVLTLLFIVVPILRDQEVQGLVSVLSLLWLLFVGFSRVYLRDHFATDILGSILLALAWWAIMRRAYLWVQQTDFKNLKLQRLKGEK